MVDPAKGLVYFVQGRNVCVVDMEGRQGRSKDDWTCHEMWERDGRTIIYHGSYVDGRAYLGRVEIPLPATVTSPWAPPVGW